MSLGPSIWSKTRLRIMQLLDSNCSIIRDNNELRNLIFYPINSVQLVLAFHIGDYTDFYSSRYHAYNVGVMFRGPNNALQPNWTWLPVGNHYYKL